MLRKAVLILSLLTIAAFLPGLAASWTSDDYALVYGIFGNPVRSFTEALSRSDHGIITPHRLLLHWFIGTGGLWGAAVAHMLALMLHFLSALLFGGLAWRLFRLPMLAFLACAWFSVAPWVSQPVLWWSSVGTIVSTICLLTAAHLFLNSFSVGTIRAFWWILTAWLATFLSLSFYDLWIAGFLLFAGIGFVVHPNADELRSGAGWRRHLLIAVMVIPFVLWCGFVAIIGPLEGQAERLSFSWERVPIVLASIHLRVANWLIGPDWPALWRMGIEALADPLEALVLVLGLGSLVFVLARLAATPDQSIAASASIGPERPLHDANAQRQDPSPDRFPWHILLFAWMMFLASRLVIVLQGGLSLESRLNYGAGFAVALGAAALARWAWHRWCKQSSLLRWSAVGAAFVSIALMTLATAGRARHIALSSMGELYTIAFLDQELRDRPEIRSVTVIGTPVPDIGELSYFSEYNGFWLRFTLRRLGHDIEARVVGTKALRENHSASEAYFRWSGNWPEARLAPVGP
jgi:hypothetical protein